MRKYLGIIAIALIFVFSFGTFFGLTRMTLNDIAGFDFQTVNEANYIKAEDYIITATTDDEANIKVSISEDGIITLNGKNDTEESMTFAICEITLEKGDYVIKSNAKRCSDDTYQVIMTDSEGGKIIANEEFAIDETTTYTVSIVVYEGAEVNTEFAPVVVDDGEATTFYVNNWNVFSK